MISSTKFPDNQREIAFNIYPIVTPGLLRGLHILIGPHKQNKDFFSSKLWNFIFITIFHIAYDL